LSLDLVLDLSVQLIVVIEGSRMLRRENHPNRTLDNKAFDSCQRELKIIGTSQQGNQKEIE
jgi:hypothetical protein